MNILKISDFLLTSLGVQESFQETRNPPVFYVLCDGLVLNNPSLGQKVAHFAERIIKKHLQNHLENINESVAKKALEIAHLTLSKQLNLPKGSFKVSCLILAEINPITNLNGKDSSLKREILMAGVGDCLAYQISSKEIKEVFLDPVIDTHRSSLTPDERFKKINNALGARQGIKVHIQKLSAEFLDNYVLACYGLYSKHSQQDIQDFSRSPFNKKTGVTKRISQMSTSANTVRLISYSCEDVNTPIPAINASPIAQNKSFFSQNLFFQRSYKRYYSAVLGLILLTCLSIFGVRYIIKPKQSHLALHVYATSSNTLSEQEGPKILRYAIPQENSELSLIAALKEQDQKQAELIEKQTLKIRSQNRALRDLQAKIRDPQAIWTAQMQKKKIKKETHY